MRDGRADVVTASAELPFQAAAVPIHLLADPLLTASVDVDRDVGCDAGFDVTLRCLIVDDNERFCDSMRGLLEQEGIVVVGVAASGDEAARIAQEVAPDVALIDINLGGESGFDVARALTAAEGRQVRHVILISTHDEREVADLVAASRALGFIAKVDLNAAAIRELLATADDANRQS